MDDDDDQDTLDGAVGEPEEELAEGWASRDKEPRLSEFSDAAQDEGAYSEDDNDSDDESNTFDPVCPESEKLDVASVYSIDLRNPILLDVLSDRGVGGRDSVLKTLVPVAAVTRMGGSSSAIKDTSSVDLEEY